MSEPESLIPADDLPVTDPFAAEYDRQSADDTDTDTEGLEDTCGQLMPRSEAEPKKRDDDLPEIG